MNEKDRLPDDDDDGEEDYAPPVRRAQQACNNCRRKKSRCPGEKPRCSTCKRLRQRCVYAKIVRGRQPVGEGDGNAAKSRHQASPYPNIPTHHDVQQRAHKVDAVLDQASLSTAGSLLSLSLGQPHLPDDIRMLGLALYFEHFHNQPFPLMARMSERQPLVVAEFPPAIVWYPMLALSLRTSKHPFLEQKSSSGETQGTKILRDLSEAAWRLLTQAYSSMHIDVHYFQGLCLLAQVDFAEGRTQRAQAQVALGIRLAQSMGMLTAEQSYTQPVNDCKFSVDQNAIVWTLFMLDRVFIGRRTSSSTLPASCYQLFLPHDGPPMPDSSIDTEPKRVTLSTCLGQPSGVLSANVELLQLWEDVVATTFQTTRSDDKNTPFWKDGSPLSRILSELLEFELKLHPHRYVRVGPPERVLQEPNLRSYFATWSFAQICYSTCHCLLHHPFIIFIKARNARQGVPLTFLQKSYRNAVIHSTWVLRLISEVEAAGVAIHNPFIGHQAAIAATIQLELTIGNKKARVAETARRRFREACSFISRLSIEWTSMQNMLDILRRLSVRIKNRQTMSLVESDYDGAIPREEPSPATVDQEDIDLFWTLLDYYATSSYAAEKTVAMSSQTEWRADSRLPNVADRHHTEAANFTISVGEQDFPSLHDEQTLNWDIYEGFDSDWSFLGGPWEAYTSVEGWCTS